MTPVSVRSCGGWLVGPDPTVMLVAKSELAFCSHARRLTKPGFPEVFDLKVDTENGLAAGLLTSPPASTLGQGLVTSGVRASGCQHPVQDRHAHGGLRLLGSEATCS